MSTLPFVISHVSTLYLHHKVLVTLGVSILMCKRKQSIVNHRMLCCVDYLTTLYVTYLKSVCFVGGVIHVSSIYVTSIFPRSP